MLRFAIAAASLAGAAPALAQEAPLEWLRGAWCTDPDAKGRRTCETWEDDGKGALAGLSQAQAANGGPVETLERMRITAEPNRLVFHADPTGQEGGDFYAVGAQRPLAVRFENAAHDYPQVVRYWREGELLLAEISLADGGKPVRWTFRRVRR